jgi:hypothetical protein
VLFAHQGGWDETLFVVVPLGLFAWILSVAKRRAQREALEPEPIDGQPPVAGEK